MPQGILFGGEPLKTGGTDRQRINQLEDGIFQLVEELRHTFRSLDADYFSEAGLQGLVKLTTQGIAAKVEGQGETLSLLEIAAKGITAKVEGQGETLSQLELTAQGIAAKVEGQSETLSQLELTTQGIAAKVEGQGDTLSQLKMQADGFCLEVENGERSSKLLLKSGEATISSAEIKFTGMVHFLTAQDLSADGETIIDGGRIKTGQIKALTFDGCTFRTTLDSKGNVGGEIQTYYDNGLAGGIRLDDTGAGTNEEERHRLFFYTENVDGMSFAMKLRSAAGCSIEAEKLIYLRGKQGVTITSDGDINIWGNVMVNGQRIGG